MTERFEQKTTNRGEHTPEALEKQALERKEQLRERIDREASKERTAERATDKVEHEAKELARSAEKQAKQHEAHTAPAEKRKEKLVRTKRTLDASFDREMKDAQAHMPAPARAFSKMIHNKTVERASEAVGSTVARPNAILSGSTCALILTAGLYFWAKSAGYPLSGFETIGAFIIGWLCGIIFDFVRIALTGKS